MQFSEHPRYLAYMDLRASGDLPGAIEELEGMLSEPQPMSAAQRAFLLQVVGSLCAEMGHMMCAKQYFLRAEEAEPGSLLVLLGSAKFLGETLGEKEAAAANCDEVVAIAERQPFAETEGDYSSAQYVERAAELKARLVAEDGGMGSAGP